MWNNVFKYLNTVAIFVLGLTSSSIVFGFQFIIVYFFIDKGAAMSGWGSSWPWNLFAGIGFVLVLIYIFWYAWRQSKKDKIEEQKKNDAIKQAVKDGMKEAIIELKKEGKL